MILDALLGRFSKSSENPANPITDDDAEVIGGDGGVRVNRDTAMATSAVWKGVGLITNYVGKLPCKINKRVGEAWEPDRDHPAYKLVHRRANRHMSTKRFRAALTKHALLDGNGYAVIIREAGIPVELWPLDPVATYPVVWYADGAVPELEYVTTVGGKMWRLSPAEVLHIAGVSDDGIEGLETIGYARDAVGLALEAERFGRMYFKSGLQPSGILMYPKRLKQPAVENLRRSFERAHSGVNKAFRLVILEEGGKLEQTTIDNEKAQFLQTRDFQLRDIANFLMLPPHKVGDTSRQGYASLEQENQSLLDESIDPWLCEWEAEYSAKLLSEQEQQTESRNVKFNRNAVVQIDIASRMSAYNTSIMSGIMNPDEVRAREELPPRPGGSAYYVPLNMGLVGEDGLIVPVSGVAEPAPTSTPTEENSQRSPARPTLEPYRELVAWSVARAFTRIMNRAKFLAVRSSAKLLEWLDVDKIDSENRDILLAQFRVILATCRSAGVSGADEYIVADNLIARVRTDLLHLAEMETDSTLAEAIGKYTDANSKALPDEFALDIIPNPED